MEDLAASLAFANYQSTLTEQKNIIRQKFQDDCVLGHSGGLFLVTPEFIAGVQVLGFDPQYIVDMNSNPIFIQDVKKFYSELLSCYQTAVEIYGTEYSKLKQQRSVKALVGL